MTKNINGASIYTSRLEQKESNIVSFFSISLKHSWQQFILYSLFFILLSIANANANNKQLKNKNNNPVVSEIEPERLGKKNCNMSKVIETTSIPIQMDTYDLNCDLQFSGGGGITDFNGAILLIDSLGDFFKFENFKLTSYPIPVIPINQNLPKKISYSEGPPSTHDIVFDKKRNQIFVSYNTVQHQQINFVVSKYAISQRASKWINVYESPPLDTPYFINKAAGGKLLMKGPKLYFSIGDFCLDRKNGLKSDFAAQNNLVPFGKIYSLDVINNDVQLISKGLRNPQGLLIDKSGHFWATDHGPRGGDELNLIKMGGNYGWPYESFGKSYAEFAPYVKNTIKQHYESPIYSWLPSIAPTGIVELEKFSDEWNGDFIIGSLKAQSLYRLRIAGDKVMFSEPIFIGHRIRSILLMNGRLVVLTDDSKLIFLYPRKFSEPLRLSFGASKEFPGRLFACLICHSFKGSGTTSMAPDFDHLYGRPIATANYSGYSDAFKKLKSTFLWDRNSLRVYLNNPRLMIKGTSMPNLHLRDDEITAIIDQLEKIQQDPNFSTVEKLTN